MHVGIGQNVQPGRKQTLCPPHHLSMCGFFWNKKQKKHRITSKMPKNNLEIISLCHKSMCIISILLHLQIALINIIAKVLNSRLQLSLQTAIASRKARRYGIQPAKAGYSLLNVGNSQLNAVTAALPLNVLASDLKP